METTSRAQTTAAAGARSGGKIVKRRRYAAAKTPYDRPPSPPSPPPENSAGNWLTTSVLPGTTRMLAKGAMKLFTFMTDTNYISSSSSDTEDEDDVVSEDDDGDVPFEKDNTVEEINGKEPRLHSEMSPKMVIEKLLLQETFSREESNKLIEIIKSRVVDCSTSEVGQGAGLMETPSRIFDTPDRSSKAVMEAKYWLEENKAGSSAKFDMDHSTIPLQHTTKSDKGSPVDMARLYMQARPVWASPSLRSSGSRTPSTMVTDLFRDESLYYVGGSLPPSAQKNDTLSAGSWNIQDEIRKVRPKATEDMLCSPPSTRVNLSTFASEHKNIQTSVVPDDGSYGDKMHVSKSLPETEPVDTLGFALGINQYGLQAEPFSSNRSTSVSEHNQDLIVKEGTAIESHHSISLDHLLKQHDANDTNSKDESISTKHHVENREAPDANGSASLKPSLPTVMDLEQHPEQPAEEVCGFLSVTLVEIPAVDDINITADGSQEVQDASTQVDMRNGTFGRNSLNEKQPKRKSARYQRKGRRRGKRKSARYQRKGWGRGKLPQRAIVSV